MPAKKGPKTIEIAPLRRERIKLSIEGETELIVQAFSQKARMQMLEKQMQVAKATKTKRPPRNPDQEFEDSLYKAPGRGKKFGFPGVAIKRAMATCAADLEHVTGAVINRNIHIVEDVVAVEGKGPYKHESVVRIGPQRVAEVRFRGAWEPGWKAEFHVEFDPDIFTAEQVVNLVNRAGFSVGICENRPGKSGGKNGMFSVATKAKRARKTA